jgi:hypothetical protein
MQGETPNLALHGMGSASADAMVKAHRILSKSEITAMDYLNFVLEAAASSPKFGLLTEWQPNGRFQTRANINALLVSPFGTGKTTNLIKMDEAVAANDISFPGMIGTINEDGDFVPGLAIQAAGKVLVIDEFQKMDNMVKNAMNSLLEYPHTYSRNLGYAVRKPFNLKRKNCRVSVKNGWISVYSKFSCISGGMYLNRKSQPQQAWASRSIPVIFRPSMAFFEKLTAGEQQIRINPHHFEGDFQFRGYMEFWKAYWDGLKAMPFVWNYFEKNPYDRGYSSRMLQDMARIACFLASLDGRQIVKKEDWEGSLRLQKVIAVNTILSDLDELEMEILQHPGVTQEAISRKMSVTQSMVSKARKGLKELGLIEGDGAVDSGLIV